MTDEIGSDTLVWRWSFHHGLLGLLAGKSRHFSTDEVSARIPADMSSVGFVAAVARYWKFSGILGRVALTTSVPSTAAAISLIWTGHTNPGAIAAVSIVAIVNALGAGMLIFSATRPDSVLEGDELLRYHTMIQAKGQPALPTTTTVEALPATPVLEEIQADVPAGQLALQGPAPKVLVESVQELGK